MQQQCASTQRANHGGYRPMVSGHAVLMIPIMHPVLTT